MRQVKKRMSLLLSLLMLVSNLPLSAFAEEDGTSENQVQISQFKIMEASAYGNPIGLKTKEILEVDSSSMGTIVLGQNDLIFYRAEFKTSVTTPSLVWTYEGPNWNEEEQVFEVSELEGLKGIDWSGGSLLSPDYGSKSTLWCPSFLVSPLSKRAEMQSFRVGKEIKLTANLVDLAEPHTILASDSVHFRIQADPSQDYQTEDVSKAQAKAQATLAKLEALGVRTPVQLQAKLRTAMDELDAAIDKLDSLEERLAELLEAEEKKDTRVSPFRANLDLEDIEHIIEDYIYNLIPAAKQEIIDKVEALEEILVEVEEFIERAESSAQGSSSSGPGSSVRPGQADSAQSETKTEEDLAETRDSTGNEGTPLRKMLLKIGQREAILTENGTTRTVLMDVAPIIKDGRTMMPARFIADLLGIKVDYINETKTANFIYGSSKVSLRLGQKTMIVNGEEIALETAPLLVNNRVLLPLRDIQEAFQGLGIQTSIEWNQTSKEITILK